MRYKILEQNGTTIENVDDAGFNNFIAFDKSGIIPNILDECSVFCPSSNSVAISPGELLIKGFRVKITERYTYSFTSNSSTKVSYQLVARIVLQADRSVTFHVVCRQIGSLTQSNLYENESGTYEIEIARFDYYGNTVSNLQRTVPKLSVSYESLLNKTQTIDSTSTSESYPSAKAVYNFVQSTIGGSIVEIDELIGG